MELGERRKSIKRISHQYYAFMCFEILLPERRLLRPIGLSDPNKILVGSSDLPSCSLGKDLIHCKAVRSIATGEHTSHLFQDALQECTASLRE